MKWFVMGSMGETVCPGGIGPMFISSMDEVICHGRMGGMVCHGLYG